jgi:membrane-associated phospholipid phosphatase
VLDQYALSHDSPRADELSYETQNFSGIWAYSLPIVLQMGRIALQSEPVGLALTYILQDSLLVTETIVFNGALNETARLVVQRPRPFVYHDPGYHGSDPHNYTSFYSGHTSFSAATNGALLFVMLGRVAALPFLLLVGIGGPLLVFFTGFFRVLSGRHFFTDVVVGAIMGSIIAWLVAIRHRTKIASHQPDAHPHD